MWPLLWLSHQLQQHVPQMVVTIVRMATSVSLNYQWYCGSRIRCEYRAFGGSASIPLNPKPNLHLDPKPCGYRAFGGSASIAAVASSLAQPPAAVAAAADGVHLFDLAASPPKGATPAVRRRVAAKAAPPQLLPMPCRCTCVVAASSGTVFAGGAVLPFVKSR